MSSSTTDLQLAALSAEERAKLVQFQEITNSTNTQAALTTLDAAAWDLDRAIAFALDDAPSSQAEPQSQRPPTPTTSAPSSANEQPQQEPVLRQRQTSAQSQPVSAPSSTAADESSGWLVGWLMWPVKVTVRTLFSFISAILSVFYRPLIGYNNSSSRMSSSTPTENATAFRQQTEQYLGSEVAEMFYLGGYTSALDRARNSGKFLLVFLQSPDHQNSHDLYSLLGESAVQQFLHNERSKLMMWGGNINTSEGYVVGGVLQAASFPFAAVVAPVPSRRSSRMTPASQMDIKMVVIDRYDGLSNINSNVFVDRLKRTMTANEQRLETFRNEQLIRDNDRMLREQQDAAYQASLQRDLQRQREQSEREERERQEAIQRENEQKQEEFNYLRRIVAIRHFASTQLSSEPAGTQNVCRLNIRLHNGERIIRKFSGDDNLESIYLFIANKGIDDELNNDPELSERVASATGNDEYTNNIDQFIIEYDFALKSAAPRRSLPSSGDDLKKPIRDVLGNAGLWPSATLFVD